MLNGLLEQVRSGRSAALVVRGEAGVGKTALLDHALESASEVRVLRTAGVESEMELAFGGLHQLCGAMLDRLGRLPDPQRDALATAFGREAGPAPDRFLVGLAVLSLLSEVAGEGPVVCVVDDAQWLDRASAQALAFAARRLRAEAVLMIFAAREPGPDLRGLPELVVEGLRDADARELLGSVVRWPLDEQVAERIAAETRGNPLALLELPRRRSPAELAGGFGLPDVVSPPCQIEESFLRRVEDLPGTTRLLLVVAAADPVGDAALVRRAARRLGIPAQAAASAAEAGLLEFGARVLFRHPLARSAAYRSATEQQRRAAHHALAEATDPRIDQDRRAWHRAQAAQSPDEDAAADLERSAGQAQARGGLAATAAFLERAAMLTPDPAQRSERALAAAAAKVQAGAFDAARQLVGAAEAGALDEPQRARVDLVHARLAFVANRGSDAPPLLLKAARQLEHFDVDLARATYLEAMRAAMTAGHHDRWDVLSRRYVELARDLGALSELPVALTGRTYMQLFAGELTAAASLVEEVQAVTEAAGGSLAPYGALGLAAWQGREDDASALIEATIGELTLRGEGIGITVIKWASSVLFNGLGRYDKTLAAAGADTEYPDEPGLANWSMVELIEAAVRTGARERAADVLRRLAETTKASCTDWALGVQARSEALLSEGKPAERLYREAIERLGRTRMRTELARAHLLYGEWLRRENRREDARGQLHTAHTMLTVIGAEGFAERARRELLTTGQTVRKRTVETLSELTAQEAQIARLAAEGHTNPEIGIQLFISPRTVEWHLRKVFAKLGIGSRRHLRKALRDAGRPGIPD